MLELYLGNGKGKTTAAVGLSVRAAGNKIPVIFAQFLKNSDSGELRILETIPEITLLHTEHFFGFSARMTPGQKEILKEENKELLQTISALPVFQKTLPHSRTVPSETPEEVPLVIVLDEALTALSLSLLPEEDLISFIDACSFAELILTGRSAPENLLSRAAYISEINPLRHPWPDVKARRGIEF